ncbi:MAG: sugar phosphate isomerase/epimerase [Spirochaetaceae bacterium]|nr:sugar phosphate isomerase/epimerase [Spirochaetaceae bacterium]MCF7948164.1 sugar phosphate isomerase/epimerase [Spirochaetia bacterium]MCF7951032.1 sugar phosphate isomerase/epimerase [Spirochaetaceae bacterium]
MIISATFTPKPSQFGPILFTGDIAESLKQIAHIGYQGAELHISDPHQIDAEQLAYLLSKHNLKLTSIGTGLSAVDDRLSFASDDESVRTAAIQRIKDVIETFADFKPSIIIGTIKGKLNAATDERTGRERIHSALKECGAFAENLGVELVLEAINRYEQDYLNTLEESVRLIKAIGAPNIKIHADIFHMNIEEASIIDSLYHYGDYLGHIHFADNNRMYPGGGSIDFKEIFRVLRAIDYSGAVSIECMPRPDGKTAAIRSYQYLSTMLAQVQAD